MHASGRSESEAKVLASGSSPQADRLPRLPQKQGSAIKSTFAISFATPRATVRASFYAGAPGQSCKNRLICTWRFRTTGTLSRFTTVAPGLFLEQHLERRNSKWAKRRTFFHATA